MSPRNLLISKAYLEEPSEFKPENLLREARRQKNIPDCPIPNVCILDPDGDIVEYLIRSNQAIRNQCWSCYHTNMFEFEFRGIRMGILGCAVGASYAVLVAEQLFVSGCQLLISITSAGVINQPENHDTRFLLITESLRDEGTSYHYLPVDERSTISDKLIDEIRPLLNDTSLDLEFGKSWTTDAPYRETASAIDFALEYGAVAVEMEAAALYAFAQARSKAVICFAHLTNTMAREGDDFEKGDENGSLSALRLIVETVKIIKP